MPVQTVEQIKKREASLAKKIAAAGEGIKPAARRGVAKNLKRAQRKRRKLVVEQERRAKTTKSAEAAPAE